MRKKEKFQNGKVKNLKMSPETYKLRRLVLDVVYDVKKRMKVELPRVEVRITEHHPETLGTARLNDNVVWIPETTISDAMYSLRQVVLHEILHACFGIDHDETCDLMCANYRHTTDKKADQLFLKWVKRASERIALTI